MPNIQENFFDKFKESVGSIDPVIWAEKHLTLDGKPYQISKSGYKPHADILRYLGVKALEKDGRPVVFSKGRQVGATILSAVLEMYFMSSGLFGNNGRPSIRVIHCFPTLIHVFTYAKTKLNTMISGAVPGTKNSGKKKLSCVEEMLDKATPANDSLQFKQFVGGNFLRVESTGLNGSRLAGSSSDVMLYDEVQLIPQEAMSNSNKLLTTAAWGSVGNGIQLYFGTPLAKGSEYYKLWSNSTQQYYHLGCEKCEELFPLYTPGSDEWEKIWLYGFTVKCTKCGCEQDKNEAVERGKWIALNPDAEYIGFHMNQLYIPTFSKEYIITQKPENHPINTERAYQNEVLGEFYSGDSSPITAEEIHEKCADLGRKFRASISPAENKNVYAGYDWGKKSDVEGSQGQSYSSAVLLSDDGTGKLNIEFFTLLKRNDFEEKKSIVDQMFRQYSVKLAVGDVGYANDLTEVLQRSHGDKFLASLTSSHVNGHQKYSDDHFPKTIVFEKDYYIAEVYDLLKKGMIRFPYGDYEKITTLIQHICSMEIKTVMNRMGEATQRYVKGPTPNDAFAALINAYLAYKFDITKGFKNQLAGPFNQGGSGSIPAVLAYAPSGRSKK
jgi:hypothetical protein